MSFFPSPDLIADDATRALKTPPTKNNIRKNNDDENSYIVKHPFAITHQNRNCGYVQMLEAVFRSGEGRARADDFEGAQFSGEIERGLPKGPLQQHLLDQRQTVQMCERELMKLVEEEKNMRTQVDQMHKELDATRHMTETARTHRENISKDSQVKQEKLSDLQDKAQLLTNEVVSLSYEKEDLENTLALYSSITRAQTLTQSVSEMQNELAALLSNLRAS
eukprot:c11153_g1_i1.p1 GENE.c11153_g1_i1~~c11153_g1_i1.p1  ORF type:complete len:221 (-),score=50.71 c11153_g1_i1:363-1025(-)